MKFTHSTLLIYGLFLMIGQAYAAEVLVFPPTQLIAPGAAFNMNIMINPQGAAIAGAQMNIAFNQSLIRINSVTEGDLFTQSGASTFFNSGIINNTTGTVINIFDAIIGRNNVSSQGNFIVINATAIGSSGKSIINLSNVKLSDPDGNLVVINVTDGNVRIKNNPPLLVYIGNRTINEGQTLTFTLSASDADGDVLTYKCINLPAGAAFNQATQTFQWTPGFTQAGYYQNVQFEVSDGIFSNLENITITVINMNQPPTFTSTPSNVSVFIKNDTVEISITANDKDNDPLSYSIKIDGIQVSTSQNYSWSTNNSDLGKHNIDMSVSDATVTITKTSSVYINGLIQGLVISNITSASGKSYTLDKLNITKLQYIDRTFTFGSVPSRYSNLTYIRTANNDKAYSSASFLEFYVNQNVTIYVAHDDRITLKPSWLNSFIDTGDNLVSGAGTFSLFAKNYTAGNISLGGNSGSGKSMYSVILRSNP